MPKLLLIEEFHVKVFVPRGLREVEDATIIETLDGALFQAELRRTLRGVVRQFPSLRPVRIRVTR